MGGRRRGRRGAGAAVAVADPGGPPSPQAGEAEAAPVPLPPEAAAELQAAARELTREAMEAEGIQVGVRGGLGGRAAAPRGPPGERGD